MAQPHAPYQQQQQQQQHYCSQDPSLAYPGQSFGSAMMNDGTYANSHQQQYPAASSPSSSGMPQGNYYGHQQQQQLGGGGGQGGNAGLGNFGNFLPQDPNMNMTAQMGVHFGQQMAQVGGDYVQKNVSAGLRASCADEVATDQGGAQ